MRRVASLLVLLPLCAGCFGGGKSTAPENQPAAKGSTRPTTVRLTGKSTGTATLKRADRGQKTAVVVRLPAAGARSTVEVARGSCAKPAQLRSPTVLGRLRGSSTSWTMPTPYAQLTSARFVVIVLSPVKAVEACGAG